MEICEPRLLLAVQPLAVGTPVVFTETDGDVVTIDATGNVIIQTDEDLGLDLVELVKVLRVMEQRAANAKGASFLLSLFNNCFKNVSKKML